MDYMTFDWIEMCHSFPASVFLALNYAHFHGDYTVELSVDRCHVPCAPYLARLAAAPPLRMFNTAALI